MKTSIATIATSLTLLMGATAVSAAPVVLYNGLSTPSQTPTQQGWLYLNNTPVAPVPSQTPTTNGVILNSGNSSNMAGYFRVSQSALNRTKGYVIRFRVKINSETHNSNNRAGFSALIVSQLLPGETQPYAIELGFWKNNIWAQSVNATRAENVAFNTSAALRTYRIFVKGDTYKLYVGKSNTPILQGKLRQYTKYTPPVGLPNPYKTPNLIFLGDDTSSATANITLAGVSQRLL